MYKKMNLKFGRCTSHLFLLSSTLSSTVSAKKMSFSGNGNGNSGDNNGNINKINQQSGNGNGNNGDNNGNINSGNTKNTFVGSDLFGKCDKPCGGGKQLCKATTELCGGIVERDCNTGPCPIHGEWSQWGSCSRSCKGGIQERTCSNPRPQFGGNSCQGQSRRKCNKHACNVLVSPNFPDNYPKKNQTVESRLTVPDGYSIRVTFQVFDIERVHECRFDFIQFCDERGRNCLEKMCGSYLPQAVTLPMSRAILKFQSDDLESGKGFKLYFEKEKSVKCSGLKGDNRCCTSKSPCQEKQGDCDDDSECAGSLVCGKDNCVDFNPLAVKSYDCCVAPKGK